MPGKSVKRKPSKSVKRKIASQVRSAKGSQRGRHQALIAELTRLKRIERNKRENVMRRYFERANF